MKRYVAGGVVLLGILATGERVAAQAACDQLHRLDPPQAVTGNGPDEFRARQSLREDAKQRCESFCNEVDNCQGGEKCRRVTASAGVPLTSSPPGCKPEGQGRNKNFKCEAQLRYCPCVCESDAPAGNLPRKCEGVHDVTFRHKIRGTSTISSASGDAEKASGRAREEMKEMARNACDAFCMSIGGCPDDDPCIRNAADSGDALDKPDGECRTEGKSAICEAALTKCKCRCAPK